MKKIGILTHYYNSKNIGGLLQSFALVNVLKSLGYQAEQISFDFYSYTYKEKLYLKLLQLENLSIRKLIEKIKSKLGINKKLNLIKQINIKEQDNLFSQFREEIPHSSIIYKNADLYKTNKLYDIFITGSDQVWCNALLILSGSFCTFAEKGKKCIAYSASSNLSKFGLFSSRLLKKGLKHLDNISVRELSLKKCVNKCTNKPCDVVLDPTFLLSKEQWLNNASKYKLPNKKYIFCYFLGDNSIWQRQKAREYADKYDYELVHLPYIMSSKRFADSYLKGIACCDVGPKEFITLINNAECVFTDSFHGMAFSINFNKQFYVFSRDDKNGKNSMISRITDLLGILGLSNRYIVDKNIILKEESIDYTKANLILRENKDRSINWLKNALKEE